MLRFLRLAVVLHFSLCFAGAVLAQGLPPIVWEGFQSQDINAIAFSPDGALLATASADRTAHLWRVEDGTTLHNLSGHSGEVRSVAFSPDGQLLATSADDNTVRIWRVSDGSLSRMFTQHNAGVACITFSPNGVHLASGDYSGRVIVWNVSDGSIVRSISNLDIVVQLAFTLSGGELVVASSQWDGFNAYGRLRWIATETGAIVRTIAAGSPITSLAVSPDGLALATIHGACFDCLRGEIKMWRATDGQRIRTLNGHTDGGGVAFSPDGLALGSASGDETVRMWRPSDGTQLLLYDLDTGPSSNCIAFSPRGTHFAYGRGDGGVVLAWNPLGDQIVPERGGNAGDVSFRITTGPSVSLATDARVVLRGLNQTDIEAQNVIVHSDNLATGTFELNGAPIGNRQVLLIRQGDSTHVMPQVFTIEQGGMPDVWADVIGRQTVRAGNEFRYTVLYGNRGNIDAPAPLFELSADAPWQFRMNQMRQYSSGPLRILGVSTLGTGGRLGPGQTGAVTIYAKAPDATSTTQFFLDLLDTKDEAFDWDDYRANVPQGITSAAWADMIDEARPEIGESMDEVLAYLRHIADQRGVEPEASANYAGSLGFAVTINSLDDGSMLQGGNVTIRPIGPVVQNPIRNVIISHGWKTSEESYEKLVRLAQMTKQHFPDANVFVVDWTPLSTAPQWYPWGPASNIEAAALEAYNELQIYGIDPANTTLIGHSFGSYVSHEIAKHFWNDGGEVDALLALNPAASEGGYRPPNLSRYVREAWAFHTYSYADTHKEIADFDFYLQSPDDMSFGEKHGWGPVWLHDRIAAGDYRFLRMEYQPIHAPRGHWDGFALMNGDYLPSPYAPEGLRDYARGRRAHRWVRTVRVGGSIDPNDKIGAEGWGEERYVSGAEPLRYTIRFENLPSATLPAQNVTIGDWMDKPKLDEFSASLGPIGWGDILVVPPPGLRDFYTEVDLRPGRNLLVRLWATFDPASGAAFWWFVSIDPDTGEPPEDPEVGFLPPNLSPPLGEGFVTIEVRSKRGLETGVAISNDAWIWFDNNDPIQTPAWTNTLDNTNPASTVSPTGVIGPATVDLQWSGSDEHSGVSDFTILVSTDGGPFEPWLQDTTETQAQFVAASGHVYAFYSLARDNAGNRQLLPGDPRADVNRDGCVDDVDLAIVLGDFGQAGNRDADVNLDGIVDDTDLAIVLINFGSGC